MNTTVVCVVGSSAAALVEQVGAAANCRGVVPDPDADVLERAMTAWTHARSAHVPWLLHDADPLAGVAEAYRSFFDDGRHGDIEVAVQQALARWRGGSFELPDYYLVVEADELAPTVRHLYLGVLHERRPARVQLAADDAGSVRAQLPRLSPARWWPALDELLVGLTDRAPDAVRLASPDDGHDGGAESGLVEPKG